MRRASSCILIILFTLVLYLPARGAGEITLSELQSPGNEKGQNHYYLGVFAYEDGAYEKAETHLSNALKYSPDDPYYNHLSGKTYLKLKEYEKARARLDRAWEAAPDAPGLKYDMAMLRYRLGEYSEAGARFSEVAEEEPANALACYYAGLCLQHQGDHEKAIAYLTRASEKSPTLTTNCYYYIGVSNQKLGRTREAAEKFEYVRKHARSDALREYASDWLQSMDARESTQKPYTIFLKAGLQYDDNVRLAADEDVYADEGDFAFSGYFSGRYDFITGEKFKIGAGGSVYQTSYYKLKDYDQTGSFLNLYASYRLEPFTFDFSYVPAYYWFDYKSFLIRHHFRPEATWRISEKFLTRLSYGYSENNYFQDDELDGRTHETGLIFYYNVSPELGYLFAEVDHEDTKASHPDYDYKTWSGELGALVKGPWDVKMKITGRYDDKKYDHVDSYFEIARKDEKYSVDMLLFRPLIRDWARILLELNYTKNDSNIKEYSYDRCMGTLSIVADF
ncbi:MAG: tetratricopeptide repeat protein [Desulfobacterales bacterium]|nr:tetratricopeptide repeat protein [Desulfobacterales bacterium]